MSETNLEGEDAGAAERGNPSPGFAGRLRFLCWEKEEDDGAEEEGSGGEEDASAGSIRDDPTVPVSGTASIPRAAGLASLLRARKLILVLDLDHTLLNSTGLRELSPIELDNGFTPRTGDDPSKGLFRLDSHSLHMLTKLRPFVRRFLQEASAMFEMYVYTLGERDYAREIAKLLDPDGVYFGARIISSAESTRRDKKSLNVVVPAAESVAAVILDDSEHVWEEHRDNLILMDRYLYFASTCRKFGYGNTSSLAELKRDERERDGALAVTLGVLRRVHRGFFDSVLDGHCSDVREVIREVRREVLRGCTVAFSRVIPFDFCAKDHPTWRMAEQLGAVCAADVDATVTHVVAKDPSTEKARWALQNNKFLVNPKWINAANFRWSRQDEQDFPVTRGR